MNLCVMPLKQNKPISEKLTALLQNADELAVQLCVDIFRIQSMTAELDQLEELMKNEPLRS